MDGIKVLDCTFRDGGYYNNWDFSPSLVSAYLQAMDASGVDAVEIGFRFTPKDGYRGPFAYSSERHLQRLPKLNNAALTVMLNAGDYVKDTEAKLDRYFAPESESPVDFVRVASHFKEIETSVKLAKHLKSLGYRTGVNLMQIGTKTDDEIKAAASQLNACGSVDVLYFADSLGNMHQEQVQKCIDIIRSVYSGELGIHTHDNMGQAASNSYYAAEQGVTWIDGTVLGMGRGAGNAATEILLTEFKRRGCDRFNAEALYPLVLEHFQPMKQQYGWGASLLYYLSAINEIHPTFIQELQSRGTYTSEQILDAIGELGAGSSLSYSRSRLAAALSGSSEKVNGDFQASGWCKDQDVLLIANGPQLAHHSEAVSDFIRHNKPRVLSLNINQFIEPSLIDAYVVGSPSRVMLETHAYENLGRPVFMPRALLAATHRHTVAHIDILDYGMQVEPGAMNWENHTCKIPYALTLPYALALASMGGARRILLAGFDGFTERDHRFDEMQQVFNLYHANDSAKPLIAITPSTYSLDHDSVYNPELS